MDEFNRGNLAAYIELLKTGIRDICLPNASAYNKELLGYVDKEARKNGFQTMLVIFNRIAPDGRKFKSYQRIVYRSGRKVAAERLKKRLQKTPKSKPDHEVIGRMLGYSQKAIISFVKGLAS